MSDNELCHFGIKGMKWGIRRYQPYPKGKHGTFLGQDRDDDIRIKKGTTAYRVQSRPDLIGEGQTYISFTKLDHMDYLTAAASGEGGVAVDCRFGEGPNNGRPYSVTLKLQQDIVAPSYQKTMDAFIKTMDEVNYKKFAKETFKYYPDKGRDFIKDYKHLKVDECRDRAYVRFVSTFMRDTKAKQIFFDNLRDNGYNALIDENDKRFDDLKGHQESPMIIFDKDESLKKPSR